MKTILSLFLCVILVSVNAWVAIIPADPATAHLGDCYTNENNLGAFTAGEEKRIEGQCAIATCYDGGEIGLTGCGTVHVEPPLRVIPGDLSKPFPDCCYEIVGPANHTEVNPEDCDPDIRNSIFATIDLPSTQSIAK
ncbi:uncharacterized protein LOC114331456 isoform X2 [Diabrotica virgifera virgifera]|uniref:Single domain-containing protein n=1 Tax=Diabrotica virgifera virgifera TaxID=50390 RepID=A0ABM5IN06_DIAVI|nr:uncharacterized protein LOC114331456 isoform X2 [Diabrotica virgifera virgifera]